MSYIDATWNKEKDLIHVVERHPTKGRVYQNYPAIYQFYYPDNNGKFQSIFGNKLSRVTCKTYKEFQKEQRIYSGKKLFESDINPVFRCLETNYLNQDAPKPNIAFFDIETDMQPFAVPSQQLVKIRKKKI